MESSANRPIGFWTWKPPNYVCVKCRKKLETRQKEAEPAFYIHQGKEGEYYWCAFCYNNANVRPQ